MNPWSKTAKPRPQKPLARPRTEAERPEQPRRNEPMHERDAGPELAWRTQDGVHGVWLRRTSS